MQSGSVGLSQKLSRPIDGASVVAASAPGSGGKWTQMAISHVDGLASVVRAAAASQAGVLTGVGRAIPASRVNEREFVFIDVTPMNGVLHHEPQDQVISVQTGITLHELNRYLAPFGQWFPVDAQRDTTLLELINRGDGGTLEHGFGAVRDLVLGLDSVTGSGALIKSGGIVVKNVTGYDTTKLFVGSHGTLALPYAAHLRLYARPEKSAAIVFHGAKPEELLLLASDLIGADLSLACCELFDLSDMKLSPQLPESTLRILQRFNEYGLLVRISGHDDLLKEIVPQIRNFKRDGTSNAELSLDDAETMIRILSCQRYPALEVSASISEMNNLLSDWLINSGSPPFQYRPSTGRAFFYAKDLSTLIELNELLRSFLVRKGAPKTVAVAATDLEYEIEYLGSDIKKLTEIKASIKERFDPSGCLNPLAIL
ncbi:MAG: FAD-binding oxidoreductase [Cyanobacteria bacterium SZAS-4]|nr:FAD-binding oxidoreductase [Cyanobacteria bacterium SZAS-4]